MRNAAAAADISLVRLTPNASYSRGVLRWRPLLYLLYFPPTFHDKILKVMSFIFKHRRFSAEGEMPFHN
jgi:hypothetical protein